MPRLIIDYPEDMEPHEACSWVRSVVKEGRISEAGGVKHFCWVTVFFKKIVVMARRKKKGQKSDSFLITVEQEHASNRKEAKEVARREGEAFVARPL